MAFKYSLFALALLASAPAYAGTFTQTNLTSDGAIQANNTDPNLVNPWGVAYSPTGPFWVSDNGTGLATVYNTSGVPLSLVVTVPSATGTGTGTPTGQVFNSTTGFVITEGANSGPAAFLFDTEDGTISGWNSSVDPTKAVIAVNLNSAGAVFKGLATYTDPKTKATYLLAADLWTGVVDVFDSKFNLVRSFRDTNLEAVYSPHNVAVFNGKIYVAYAWVNAQRNDVIPHAHWGVVEEVNIKGKVMAQSVGGLLNAPWGLAVAPPSFGKFAGDILVGNFGDGRITAFTAKLKPKGQLDSAPKTPISIPGLWALTVGNGGSGGSASDVYFTAGPNDEADGLFGSLAYTK
jgi:uncharacterized protein (TIGR03118 family)